ncbi:hypothetical protein CEXT_364011 [Caerostris extrusa]|uniref:Uncharacterized protein n=1 Tax=Caerostris extrusa TaxID=172846 RepID=A0AAV4WPH8_CAEEX|nr:hypothetical protein CEXT_364011 [Caerostris extrusa]
MTKFNCLLAKLGSDIEDKLNCTLTLLEDFRKQKEKEEETLESRHRNPMPSDMNRSQASRRGKEGSNERVEQKGRKKLVRVSRCCRCFLKESKVSGPWEKVGHSVFTIIPPSPWVLCTDFDFSPF